jgi:hypothetical protein
MKTNDFVQYQSYSIMAGGASCLLAAQGYTIQCSSSMPEGAVSRVTLSFIRYGRHLGRYATTNAYIENSYIAPKALQHKCSLNATVYAAPSRAGHCANETKEAHLDAGNL